MAVLPAKHENAVNTAEPVVRISDVSLHYGKTLALNHITVDVQPRQLVGLIGPD